MPRTVATSTSRKQRQAPPGGPGRGGQGPPRGTIPLSAAQNVAIAGTASADLGFAAGGQSISLGNATLANQNVLTVTGANATIQSVDAALATVSSFQSTLGGIPH